MPRPKKDGSVPKTRSRLGCHPCKAKKVKCGEEKPICKNCQRLGETCDYSIRLNWGGRSRTKSDDAITTVPNTPGSSTIVFPSPDIFSGRSTPKVDTTNPPASPLPPGRHVRSRSTLGTAPSEGWNVDPVLFSDDMKATGSTYLHPGSSHGMSHVEQTEAGPSDLSDPHYMRNSWQYPPVSNAYHDTAMQHNMMMPMQMSPPIIPSNFSDASHATSPISDDPNLKSYWKAGHERMAQEHGRRGSVPVSSLLIDSPPEHDAPPSRRINVKESISTFFGYDRGNPDLDVGMNDDSNAIVGSPAIQTMMQDTSISQTVAMAFERGEYYARPVPIKIPRHLLPLPDSLVNNHMNLLYFHHFLNHTARILVPLDCPINPYRNVLPRMAVHDEDLLNLLLAYSACHRSRLLKHREPETRIARYVQDVFPRLRSSLSNPGLISINSVATSIMLASLEIISPGAFGVRIPWYTHLSMARDMFISRVAILGPPEFDEETFFLARWFGYLDILGSLSRPGFVEPLSFDNYWVEDPNESDNAIDCLLGCTRTCMRLLAQVAQLVKECESTRLDANHNIRDGWYPPYETDQRAKQLMAALYSSCDALGFTCTHGDPSVTPVEEALTDMREILSTNKLYHWAAIIQLYRRVYNYPKEAEEVRHAVRMVVECLDTIRDGSPAEACLLFPIFTAACENMEWDHQDRLINRISGAEEFGMKQVIQAKELVQKTWETGQPWVSIASEEFIG